MGCGNSKPKAATPGSKKGDGKDDKDKAKNAGSDRDRDKAAAKEQNKGLTNTMMFLSQVPLFKRLPKDQHPMLASACTNESFQGGAVVIQQGDTGEAFYIIKSGEASVEIKDADGKAAKVASLKGGDYFGENALLRDEPRAATVTATSNLECLKITRDKFQELGLHEKLEFARRLAVGGGGVKQIEVKPPSPKTTEERRLIAEALKKNENLQTMAKLDDERVNHMVDIAWKEHVERGKELISEGDLTADYFYIVQDGSFEIFQMEQEDSVAEANDRLNSHESKYVSTIGSGGSFGELALLYLVPRAATVKAKEPSMVWVIDRQNFKNILMKVSETKIKEYCKLLDAVEILNSLLREEKKELAKALIEMHFTKGEVVLQQGDMGNTFYILYDGDVAVTKDGAMVTELHASSSGGVAQYFGERALLNKEPRAATVTVSSSKAKALCLDRESFELLLGPLGDIMKKQTGQDGQRVSCIIDGKRVHTKIAPVENNVNKEKVEKKDLKKVGFLGAGGFGTVLLYEHVKSGKTYAMKALSKGYIIKTGMQDSVMNEKMILSMTNSPFVIILYQTYNGAQTLYFLMEPALGGELYATYHRKGFHGSEKHARYYAGSVLYAFEHLHNRHIIYRDLKPENLLLNDLGHMKLTDMGLAKFVIGKTYTTCGTPDYFAPELIASSGHTNAVDWWTLGILIFELLSGHPPFESAYPMQIYSKVTKGISKIPFPAKCQGDVETLIKGLLKAEPSERLPMRPGGIQNLKEHKWYAGFDWETLNSRTMTPPYSPVVKSLKDLGNFKQKEDGPRQIEYTDPGTGWDKDF